MPGPKKPADESNQQLKHGKPLTPAQRELIRLLAEETVRKFLEGEDEAIDDMTTEEKH